ncbi:sugar kinase, partial [Streptomyces ipomoeae]|uniref:sugar kinase n=3 Tax=Streptomyces ipomoeae TaxID=103232 RepID=UPI0029CAABB5
MVTFLPTRPGLLADVPSFERAIGGAESNVACVLAAAGHTVRWVSRVGADGFGDHLVEAIGEYGVDVSAVRRDPTRPTGVYFRTAGDRATDAHEVAYYRAGSAASAMTAENMDLDAIHAARVLHLSGITAALSDNCRELLRTLTAPRPTGAPLISFDVNHRPALWQTDEGPQTLLDLARSADIVFVGEDEAEETWGIKGGPTAIRALLPQPATLVVKQGARGATLFERTPPHTDHPRTAARGCAGGCPPAAAGVPHRAHPHETAPAGPRTETPRRAPDPTPTTGEPTTASSRHTTEPETARPRHACRPTTASPRHTTQPHTTQPHTTQPHTTEPHTTEPETTSTGRRPTPDTVISAPAPTVHVTAATGAGDAFAAGFLSATLRGLPAKARLRQGHLMAAATLTAPGALADPPPPPHPHR